MKAYKIELLIIDFDEVGSAGIVDEIENAHYGNDCISPYVQKVEVRDIGQWSDEHPLNQSDTCDEEYARLFG